MIVIQTLLWLFPDNNIFNISLPGILTDPTNKSIANTNTSRKKRINRNKYFGLLYLLFN